LPDWLVLSLLAAGFVAVLLAKAHRNTQRMVARTLQRRPNPTESEFVAILSRDVNPETAEFVWFAIIEYLARWQLTPDPDDHLFIDLPIDEDDPMLDWMPRYARLYGADWKFWPAWPKGWRFTVRNFARWLEFGLAQQSCRDFCRSWSHPPLAA
jgi:hypothetical protein